MNCGLISKNMEVFYFKVAGRVSARRGHAGRVNCSGARNREWFLRNLVSIFLMFQSI
jgi:hypothetical protein